MPSEETITHFLHRCTIIKPLPTEHALTINLSAIVGFYADCVGTQPILQAWEEIREFVEESVKRAKYRQQPGIPFHIRLVGSCSIWLAIKIYAAVVWECDQIFYVGDVAIPLTLQSSR
jgi:hypothetical protein